MRVTSGDGGLNSCTLSATVFDNATAVGRKVGETIHETELFSRMRAHCEFFVQFCNLESGHVKGNVEAKVGYTRRNLFVPVPAFDDIEDYNNALLPLLASKAQKSHYKKLLPNKDLLEEDIQALLPFLRIASGPVRCDYQSFHRCAATHAVPCDVEDHDKLSGEYSFEITMRALGEDVQCSQTSFNDAANSCREDHRLRATMAPEQIKDLYVYDEFLKGVHA